MLLRSGRLPTGGDDAFEPKWDGFRGARVFLYEQVLRVKSRRGWDMTSLVRRSHGELVAFGSDGPTSPPLQHVPDRRR